MAQDEFTEEDTVPDTSPESLAIVFNYDQLIKDRSKMHKLTRKSNSSTSPALDLESSTYYIGASNNFARVFTLLGRKYWIAQAMSYHRAPDFKIHFSIKRKHVPKAFNLIGKMFFESGMKFGMKAIMIDDETEVKNTSKNRDGKLELNWNTEGGREGNDRSFTLEWPDSMKGREITVYIYRYFDMTKLKSIWEYDHNDHEFRRECSIYEKDGKYHYDNFTEFISQPFKQFELIPEMEESLRMYRKWIRCVECELEKEGIEPNGCADGDLSLGGKYASFRNETFVPIMNAETITNQDVNAKDIPETSNNSTDNVNDLFYYPPNFSGWNAANNPEGITMYQQLHLKNNEPWDNFLDRLPLIAIVMTPLIIAFLSAGSTR